MRRSKRLDLIPPYLFAEIDRKIGEAKAKGFNIISLGIGDPDTPTIEDVVAEMHKAIDDSKNHDYPPYNGTKDFREASCKWMKERFGVELDADKEMLANIGSKEAIAHVFFALVDEGDYTLVPDPGYPVYKNATIFAGGTPYSMPLSAENHFLPDFDKIPKEIAKKSKLMFLNYPNNPTGAVCDLDFFKKAVDFCKKYDILLCHDQAYCEMTYDGYVAPSVLQVEGAKDIAVEFFSFSKPYAMTGWRLGWVCGNAEALSYFCKQKTTIDTGIFKAIQNAGANLLNSDEADKYNAWLNNEFKRKRDLFANGLKKLGYEIPIIPDATFYLWVKMPKCYDSSEKFCADLLEKSGIMVVPGEGFGDMGKGYFRVSYVCSDEKLQEVLDRMEKDGFKYN